MKQLQHPTANKGKYNKSASVTADHKPPLKAGIPQVHSSLFPRNYIISLVNGENNPPLNKYLDTWESPNPKKLDASTASITIRVRADTRITM